MPKRTKQSPDASPDKPETPAAASPGNQPRRIGDQQIADLAYQRWVERGCPQGSPEEDWFAAERDLTSRE